MHPPVENEEKKEGKKKKKEEKKYVDRKCELEYISKLGDGGEIFILVEGCARAWTIAHGRGVMPS